MDLELLEKHYRDGEDLSDEERHDRALTAYLEIHPESDAAIVSLFLSELAVCDTIQSLAAHFTFNKEGVIRDCGGNEVGTVRFNNPSKVKSVRSIINEDLVVCESDDTPQTQTTVLELDDIHVKTQEQLAAQFDVLVNLPQPEQRTAAWYDMRKTRLTASDLAGAIGESKYDTPYDILLKKCGGEKPFTGNAATQHGVKYEPIATQIYEKRNSVKIKEFGLIAHPTVPFLGASPDGIVEISDNLDVPKGTMLEIKCPPTRVIDGIVPKNYLIQMLLQLECCDLEVCDFEECKISEYYWEEDYWEDAAQDDTKTASGMEKGIILEYYDHEEKKVDYKYPPLGLPKQQLLTWIDVTTQNIIAKDTWAFNRSICWHLEKYSCVRVLRDRVWWAQKYPIIEAFWKDVLFYRVMGLDKLRADFDKKERQPRLKKPDGPIDFLSDSEEESHSHKKLKSPKSSAKKRPATKRSISKSTNKSRRSAKSTADFLTDSD